MPFQNILCFSIYNVTLCSISSFQRALDIIQPNNIFSYKKYDFSQTQINSNAKNVLKLIKMKCNMCGVRLNKINQKIKYFTLAAITT